MIANLVSCIIIALSALIGAILDVKCGKISPILYWVLGLGGGIAATVVYFF